jgi:hypothetical protein
MTKKTEKSSKVKSSRNEVFALRPRVTPDTDKDKKNDSHNKIRNAAAKTTIRCDNQDNDKENRTTKCNMITIR